MVEQQANVPRHILATDLDGTLIPLESHEQNRRDLERLQSEVVSNNVEIVFVTGRHLESVLDVAQAQQLPLPRWIICDVGTSIYQRESQGWTFSHVQEYQAHQGEVVGSLTVAQLQERLSPIDGLRLQESEKQGPYKLSYYVDAVELEALVDTIQQHLREACAPYEIIHSVDPFNGDGLIDLLPRKVSKAYALAWWAKQVGVAHEDIVFAGDSGNDLAALTAGYRAIVVGNADRKVARLAEDAHRNAGWSDRLYLAKAEATSGVLEGCRWFDLLSRAD